MAETVDGDHNAAFWLPTHFLTDDDFIDHNSRSPSKDSKNFDLFSGGFDPFFGPSSETEPEPERDQHDDDFLAELTRHLVGSTLLDKSNHNHNASEVSLRFSSSPQSTLSGFGGWSNRSGLSSNGSPNAPSQVPSPPVTPPAAKNDAAWELLYKAAREVARLKMNAIVAAQRTHDLQNRGLIAGPRNPPMSFSRTNQFQTVKRQDSSIWGKEREEFYCHHRRGPGGVGALGLPQSAWPPLGGSPKPLRHQQHHQQSSGPPVTRPVFLGGSGLGSGSGAGMKKSTGTGVFLPRRPVCEPPAESRRKSSAGMPVLLPARVVQALNLDLEGMNGDINLNSQSRFGCGGFVTDQELLLARKNSVMGHQRNLRRDLAATMAVQGHEVCLPSDWTY